MPSFGLGGGATTRNGVSGRVANDGCSNTNMDSSTPWMAASEGKLQLLQRSLRALNLPISCSDDNGYTLLQAASSYNHLNIMKWIIDEATTATTTPNNHGNSSSSGEYRRSVVNAVDNDGDCALHYANTVEVAKYLIEVAKISTDIPNNDGKTALESKREELEETMQDDDDDGDDSEDVIKLRALVEYLSGLESRAQ